MHMILNWYVIDVVNTTYKVVSVSWKEMKLPALWSGDASYCNKRAVVIFKSESNKEIELQMLFSHVKKLSIT